MRKTPHRRTVWSSPLLVGGAALLLGALVLFVRPIAVSYPQDGRWTSNGGTGATIRDSGFAYLREQLGANGEQGNGLKVFYAWPGYRWIVFSEDDQHQGHVAILAHVSDDRYTLRQFAMSHAAYQTLLASFDDQASGIRVQMSGGYDGFAIAYERWRNGRVTSYEGNASFNSKDARVKRLVDGIANPVGPSTREVE